MGKFSETKKKIMEECSKPGAKKTFNKTMLNELGTALLNDATYVREEVVVKDGALVPVTSNPTAELRKQIIGSVAKSAGCDQAEQQKLIEEHQFPQLDVYGYVDSLLQEYLSTGKKYVMGRQENFQASIETETVKAGIKEVRRPGATEKTKQRQGEFVKLKAKSTCPDNLKQNL
ncbi:MAG: hypothetical protein NC548_41315 [Lachnospiraceae bacterium]|nr:hypothetical protein [Lachnospiraceae bacterium]